MDVKLKDGDMVLDFTGNPVYTQGLEEVLQKVMICITADKGGFIYKKDMGCVPVTDISGERELKRLEARLKEAALPVVGAEIFLNSAEQLIDGCIKAHITVTFKGEEISAEVIL